MLKGISFGFTLLCAVVTLAQQPALLQGRMPQLPGATVSVLALDDGFSGARTLLTRAELDDYGNFELEVGLKEITPLFLHVDGLVATLYAEPGGSYAFTVPGIDRKDPHSFQHMQVELDFNKGDYANINVQLAEFNKQYDFFFQEFLPDLVEAKYAGSSSYVRSNRDRLVAVQLLPEETDSSKSEVNRDFIQRIDNFKIIQAKTLAKQRENAWMADYIDYALATTEISSGRSRAWVYNEYFANKPVQFKHPEYVTALEQLYKGWLVEAMDADTLKPVRMAMLRERSALSLDSAVAELPMMTDAAVRHAALLSNLKDMYYRNRRDRNIPLSVLKDMAAHPEIFGWAAASAQRMVDRMEFGKSGTPAPSFVFRTVSGDLVESETLNDTFIYVQVFTKWCRSCVSQMDAMRAFQKRYKQEVQFISLSMDPEFQTFTDFVDGHDYDWMFGYGPADAEFQDRFNLTSVPQYFLIDPEGNWAVNHIAAPDQGGLGVMEQQIVKWRNDHQTRSKPYMGR